MIGVETTCRPCALCGESIASMGPRHDWRGDLIPRFARLFSWELQWGHAMIGVETASRRLTSQQNAFRLQWGHAMIGVETRQVQSHPIRSPGFNGATP